MSLSVGLCQSSRLKYDGLWAYRLGSDLPFIYTTYHLWNKTKMKQVFDEIYSNDIERILIKWWIYKEFLVRYLYYNYTSYKINISNKPQVSFSNDSNGAF